MKKKGKKVGNKHSPQQEKTFIIERISPVVHFAIIVILGIIIYSNTFNSSFHFDDIPNIVENSAIKDIKDFSAINNHIYRRVVGFYTFALNYHFHELDVPGYHVVNLLIHLSASIMAWWLSFLILSTPVMRKEAVSGHKKTIALAVGLLFVSHPVQTQAVTYIVQRLASLSTLFYLTSLALYVKARLTVTKRSSLRSSLLFFTGAALSAFLGMFTKETVFTLPFAVMLTEISFFYTGKIKEILKNRTLLLYSLPVLMFALIIPGMMYIKHNKYIIYKLFRIIPSQRPGDPLLSSAVYLMTQFRVIVTYIRLLFVPVNQNLDYDFPASHSFFEFRFFELPPMVGFVILVLIFFGALWLFQRKRLLSFGILWFFLTLSVESSFKPISNVIFEHRLYLPMLGFCLFITGSLYHIAWKKYRKAAVTAFLILICVMSVLTFARNKVWEDEITLCTDIIKKSPNKARPYVNRGKEYILMGEIKKAREDIERALELDPDNPQALNDYGIILYKQSSFDEGIKYFYKAAGLEHWNFKFYYNLGNALYEQGRYEEAFKQYDYIRGYISRDNAAVHNLMGKAASRKGDYDVALKNLNKALELDPELADAHFNFGKLLQSQDKSEEAIEHYMDAIRIDPKMAEAYSNCGAAYYMIGKPEDAKKYLTLALQINPDYAEAHNNLGLILFENENFNEAVKHFTRAVQINPRHETAIKYLRHILKMQGKIE